MDIMDIMEIMENQSSYRDIERLTSLSRFLDFANEPFAIASALCLPFLLTYLVTLWRFRAVLRSKKKGKEPPTLPFLVPVLSHAIPFAWDTRVTLSTITYVFIHCLRSAIDLQAQVEVL